ncbi:MAG: ROK family transcriptional regulator [Salaquimonas sp.]
MLMKAGSDTLRTHNRALVLSTMRQLGPVSHTEISEWSGLSSATVSAITHELEQQKIIIRQEQKPSSGRGRPRVAFVQNAECAFIATVRILYDAVEYSLVDYSGTLKDRFEIKRNFVSDSRDHFIDHFVQGLDRLAERSDLARDQILTISITSKGLVSRGTPVLLWSPVFADERIDFEEILRPYWKALITLKNETRFAARAVAEKSRKNEMRHHYGDHATLSLDHSIGLGIAGADGAGKVRSFAPPFGHMVHDPDGPKCRCGSKGCIESYSGFYGILRIAFEVSPDAIPAKFIPFEEMEKIAQQAREGDRMAGYAFRQAGDVIGMGLSRLHSFLGTMPITITGPGANFLDLMLPSMEVHIKNNLQVRFENMPALTVEMNEAGLIYEGNVQASLGELDVNVIAKRKLQESE